MKSMFWRYGFISIGLMALVLVIGYVLGVRTEIEDFDNGKIVGYSSMIIALLAIYFAIKKYRDEHNGGSVTFWQAFKIGLIISLFPSVLFAAYNHVYVEFIDPDFMVKYTQYTMQQASGGEVSMDAVMTELERQKEEMPLFFNVYFQDALMFFNVFIFGVILSVIFGVILKKDTPSKINLENELHTA